MALMSQNGWQAATTYTGHGIPLTSLRWVTGTVRSGDVHTVLDYLGERFHNEVEPIHKPSSWGFAPRQIRGKSTTLSNHASGTAVDFNAPHHGIGLSGTFSPQQRRAIENILDDLAGTVRWGGHYTGRKDEMHFEVNCTPGQLARVADKIRKGNTAPKPAPTPNPTTIPEGTDMNAATLIRNRDTGATVLVILNGPKSAVIDVKDTKEAAEYTAAGVKQVNVHPDTFRDYHNLLKG